MEILAGKISSYLIYYYKRSFRETGFSSKDTYHSPETIKTLEKRKDSIYFLPTSVFDIHTQMSESSSLSILRKWIILRRICLKYYTKIYLEATLVPQIRKEYIHIYRERDR